MPSFNTYELYSANRYEEIISLWSDEEMRARMNEWDWWYCLLSFNKLKRYEDALNAFRVIRGRAKDSQDPDLWKRIYCAVGWALYYSRIKPYNPEHGDRNTLYKQVDFIVQNCQDNIYSPLTRTVMLVSKWMKDQKLGTKPDYCRMARYLEAVNPSNLSTEENTSADGKPFASECEMWYIRRAKALLETKQYENCIRCVEEALTVLPSFHNNDDAWLHMYEGDCLAALGRTEEAKKEYKKALLDMSDWNLYLRLFRVEAKEGNTEQALYYAARCGLSSPFTSEQDDKRVRFYADFADYLALQGMTDEALLHRRHALHIYASNPTWKAPSKWQIPDELMTLDRRQTARRLSDIWKGLVHQHTEWKHGHIEKLFPGGRNGLIVDEQQNQFFFSARDYLGKRSDVALGLKVNFATEMRRNRKKGTVEPVAVMIERFEE